jgi:hypothetical protein
MAEIERHPVGKENGLESMTSFTPCPLIKTQISFD